MFFATGMIVELIFLSTSSARRTTDKAVFERSAHRISIHVLREEDDLPGAGRWTLYQNFYPRPPRGGRRAYACCTPAPSVFLSTSSARRTTQPACCRRAVCRISIHVLREEDDPRSGLPPDRQRRISIHVLREEDDVPAGTLVTVRYNFYPRPPRGGRPDRLAGLDRECKFLSTSSARRTTGCSARTPPFCRISIHVLREEDDRHLRSACARSGDFYPRPPRGGRRDDVGLLVERERISIHVLREEDDHAQRG